MSKEKLRTRTVDRMLRQASGIERRNRTTARGTYLRGAEHQHHQRRERQRSGRDPVRPRAESFSIAAEALFLTAAAAVNSLPLHGKVGAGTTAVLAALRGWRTPFA